MIKEIFLHAIGTIGFSVAFAGLLNLMGFTGYYAGYSVGAFFMMYYFTGMNFIEKYKSFYEKSKSN